MTEYPLDNDANCSFIISEPEGRLRFTSVTTNVLGQITTDGALTEIPIPSLRGSPYGLVTGPDGNVWFVLSQGNAVVRFTP